MTKTYLTEDEATQKLSEIYSKQGYLVLARGTRLAQYEVGQIVSGIKLFACDDDPMQQKFRVTAVATFGEYLEQCAMAGAERADVVDYYAGGTHQFYRVESD